MKTLDLHGITYISPVPYGTDEWYYGISYEHGDLYEAEEIWRAGGEVQGRELCLIHYPDGAVYWPVPKQTGIYTAEPVFCDGRIYIAAVDFPKETIQILAFDCAAASPVSVIAELPLSSVRDCYNLMLHTSPVCLTRQGHEDVFEIIWPERTAFDMGEHESFFLRDGDRLYFSKWYEEGDGVDYRYWEETVIRDISGEETERFGGDVMVMPNGGKWLLK